MPTTISSREFDRDASGAKMAALPSPAFITDRGRPAHVLLSIEEYRRLAGGNASISTCWPCQVPKTLRSNRRGRKSRRAKSVFSNARP